ncbi:MFS transporter [Lactiplantibacillus daowaiensis]|uniref:MFS transporter n=1 Tax=Lactiplantibacillus daowaiensis TaxID=2559918 RepID=A0ABW1S2M0_9LACO
MLMTADQSKKQLLLAVTALLFANLGSSIFSFAMGLFLLKQYSSAGVFGISQAIGPLVSLALAPILRLFIDRVPKQQLITGAQLLSIVGLIGFAGLVRLPQVSLVVAIILILVVLRIADQLFDVTYMASAVMIVAGDDIQKLKSYEQMVSSIATIIGPVIAAAWFAAFHMQFEVFVLAELGCEAIALVLMRLLTFRGTVVATKATKSENEIKFILQDKVLTCAIWLGCAINFFYTAFSIGLPYLQIHILKLSSQVYASSEAAVSIGVLVASYLLAKRPAYQHPLNVSWQVTIGFSSLFLIMGLVLMLSIQSKLILAGFMITFNFITGLLIAWLNTPTMVWLTEYVPEHLQGRVFNISRTLVQVLMPIGILIASFAFDHFAASWIFIVTGVIFIVTVVLYPKLFGLKLDEV